MAYGIGPGDAVFTTPFTFFATAEMVSLLGRRPFLSISIPQPTISTRETGAAIEAVKTDDSSLHPLPRRRKLSPKGIIPVDLFGLLPITMPSTPSPPSITFSSLKTLPSLRATYQGKRSCFFGQIACTSFFPAKPLGCYGDGGMCFTDEDALAIRLDSIRVHGKGNHKYDNAGWASTVVWIPSRRPSVG